MGISIVRFQKDGEKWGVLEDGVIYELKQQYETLAHFLKEGVKEAESLQKEAAVQHQQQEVELLSPVTAPAQIVCQGANYAAHREEGGLDAKRPPFNMIFTKAASSLSGPGQDIESPKKVKLLDYEIELGLVFKKELNQPLEDGFKDLSEYIAGFIITNDVSSRDIQFTENQWYKGKSFRTFCPAGPVLYLIDQEEAEKVHDLELTLKVNGEVRQQANTTQLLYKPEETLVELSRMMNFYPGDLLMTGTPGGVALKLSPEDMNLLLNPFEKLDKKVETLNESQGKNEHYLKEGDVITSEIKSRDGTIDLGLQENKVRFI
ncbi:fumarylacetoacetate hydrolase family protein [Alkalicoccus daliensis]|uniref:2-keto-4-pentenoate hydratase/2-oxohepta-3-ene-1,7-dioic acid hydratase (Catechol pathway) n=1 Tax=Alkalicoccus daliensis TaxID=745820 RepID=A0A1H0F4Q1_9BACI|nr:fumarylacetoacetate hydrolase family protein [Alkalicoccus daliensis]SDN89637.1 2-keto-4-pentenoate hydratase/2-oxohepta-3-ene-1,7-dioic acid hydratase (catechol pathway) [Alkalicoccus daliensis]